jgi:hypothetical protein
MTLNSDFTSVNHVIFVLMLLLLLLLFILSTVRESDHGRSGEAPDCPRRRR